MTLEDRSINDHKKHGRQPFRYQNPSDVCWSEPRTTTGLIPLQQDPTSGLWEFAHKVVYLHKSWQLCTHSRNKHRTDIDSSSSFWMGATTEGEYNVDPEQRN